MILRARNQIAPAKEQLFIIRTLNVKNQVEQGPKREAAAGVAAPAPGAPVEGAKPAPAANSIKFIVGAEHLDVNAKLEIISLNQEKGAR